MSTRRPDEPRFKVAHLFRDETLRSAFGSSERSMPEAPVFPAHPVWEEELDENGLVPSRFASLRVIDRLLSEVRYRRINGIMRKDDRQNYRVFEKMRAIAATIAEKR